MKFDSPRMDVRSSSIFTFKKVCSLIEGRYYVSPNVIACYAAVRLSFGSFTLLHFGPLGSNVGC